MSKTQIIIALITASSFAPVYGSSITGEIDHLVEIEEEMNSYQIEYDKLPSYLNLLDSIDVIPESEPSRKGEMTDALRLLALMEYESTTVAEKVKQCYERNNPNKVKGMLSSTMTSYCGHILLKTDIEYSSRIFKAIMLNETERLNTRIMAATALAGLGDFSGEFLLKKGLASDLRSTRQLSEMLQNSMERQRTIMAGEPAYQYENKYRVSKFLDENMNFSLERVHTYRKTELERIKKERQKLIRSMMESTETVEATTHTLSALSITTNETIINPVSISVEEEESERLQLAVELEQENPSKPWKFIIPILGILFMALLVAGVKLRKNNPVHSQKNKS